MTPPRWCEFLQPMLLRRPADAALCGQPPTPAAAADCGDMQQLRVFKYRELLKLCTLVEEGSGRSPDSDEGRRVREMLDASPSAMPPERMQQQRDWLTERVLHLQSELAVHIVRRAMALHFDEGPLPCVLALGKLGAEELNFSSDIDLVFLAPDCGDFPGGEEQYGKWLADSSKRLTAMVRELELRTEEGFLYRVDLRLRPWGDTGPLLGALEPMQGYYFANAGAWEHIAMLRARPIAGDLSLGHTLLHNLRPFLYPRRLEQKSLMALLGIKQDMQDKRKRDAAWDVKAGEGGIRDLEFFVHVMQWLHGARNEALHTTRTLELLKSLGELSIMDQESADGAMEAYLFLRAVENALQMRAEQQCHHLPEQEEALGELAKMLFPQASSPRQQFETKLEEARKISAELFSRLLPQDDATWLPLEEGNTVVSELSPWDVDAADSSMERWQQLRKKEGAAADSPADRLLLRSIFGASWYCSRYLFYRGPADRPQLHADSPESMSLRTAAPEDMEQLRSMHSEAVLRVLSWDLRAAPEQQQLEQRLSLLARNSFRHALRLFRQRHPVLKHLVVMAMGRLAVSEMNYGSDLDLIFLSTDQADDAAELRVAIGNLLRECQQPTPSGLLYRVDTRLRPYGGSGPLVSGLESFRDYHTGSRETWERQAMTRCRVMYGTEQDSRALWDELGAAIYKPRPAKELAKDIYELRLRIERELGSPAGRVDVKRGRGGIMDLDFVAHYLQLLHGKEHPSLRLAGTRQCLRYSGASGLCQDTTELLKAYDFLKRVEGRLRVFDMDAISTLPDSAHRLAAIARGSGDFADEDQLKAEIESTMHQARQQFEQFLEH